jgi:ribosomal protein S18 acetylase RimI-like enzyme
MNFYSDIIVNNIIDNYPLDSVIETIEKFGENCFNTIMRYSRHNINYNYIFNVLGNTNNIVAFHCLDNDFNINNCPSILIYNKLKCKNEINYYILAACTHPKFRNQGYASKLLDGVIERIKNENADSAGCVIKIILSSVEESVVFYERYGFKWTRQPITQHRMLLKYEKYDKNKEYFIMEYTV